MNKRLVGLLLTRNVLSQGYPFLESIYSFLNVGDMLYILDGNSTDGTTAILSRLSKNRRIKIFNSQWVGKNKDGGIIGDMYTKLLNKVKNIEHSKSTCVFELQANDIIHEDSYHDIINATELLDNLKGLFLPYSGFMGTYLIGFTWRVKMSMLKNKLSLIGDGTNITVNDDASYQEILKTFASGTYNKLFRKNFWQPVFRRCAQSLFPLNLSKPIFRYTLFPEKIKFKAEEHMKLYPNSKNHKLFLMATKKTKGSLDAYYKNVSKAHKKIFSGSAKINRELKEKIERHPLIMQDLLSKKDYYIRAHLMDKIVNL